MANVVNFTTADLDYDSIVENLKNYLRYQDEFKDYDFQGSALATLIDLLAYNTHYNGVYDNFTLNEAFLDSAYKRNSVISHAQLINYLPRSANGATAIVNLTVTDNSYNDSLNQIVLPKYSTFSTTIDNVEYTFSTDSINVFTRDSELGNTWYANNVTLRCGTYITTQSEYTGDSNQKFVLQNDNVDTNTISVQVLHNTELYKFTKADNILANTSDSKVYFLSMNSRGKYVVEFGSGILGYSLSAGDIVYITYLNCDNDPTKPNYARDFTFTGSLTGLGFTTSANLKVYVTQPATGGQLPESTESIRTLAPKIFSTQDRCITANDYKSMIMKYFDNIRAINVWGGQDNDPPMYGKVLVSIIPKNELTLTTSEKNEILTFLQDKKELTKIIEFVDPSYLYVIVNAHVHYDSNKTTSSVTDIAGLARQAITDYNDDNLKNFGSVIRFSALSKAIDDCDPSIVNNSTTIRLAAVLSPNLQVQDSYIINISNPIYKPLTASESVLSTGFYCKQGPNDTVCYIDDNPVTGKLRLFYYNSQDQKIIYNSNIGTIDYSNGTLVLNNITVTDTVNGSITFTINPSSNDVVSGNDQFTIIANSDISVTVIDDNTNSKYTVVSSK